MSGKNKNLRGTVCAIALASVLAGCGGGSTPSAGSPNNGSGNSDDNTPAEIQGVDTPSSVSVVTATNAN